MKLLSKRNGFFYTPISPIYGLFSLLACHHKTSFLFQALTGCLWGIVLEFLASTVNRKIGTGIKPMIYGLLNILNCAVLEPIIENLLSASSPNCLIIASLFGTLLYLIDLSISLRNAS